VSVRNAASFERPSSLEEAFALVSAGGVPVSGGTSVILRSLAEPRPLVDLTALPLAGIEERDGGIIVGATTTLTDMLEHPAIPAVAGGEVADVLKAVGSPLLRNVATIGGHLARGRLSDIVPILLAIDATIDVYDGERRTLPLADYYRQAIHETAALITAVHIVRPVGPSATAFLKFSRTRFDYALLNTACRIDRRDGVVSAARIVVGETPALAASVVQAEEALRGRPLDVGWIARAAQLAAEHVPVETDQRASADYRRHLTRVLVGRCLETIRERLG
jgi:CO/xanthine dehydrogenase FAD-binding subunit